MALPSLFVLLAGMQLAGLLLAALFTGPLMLAGLALTIAAIDGKVLVDDALVARFVPAPLRAKAYGPSYCLGFAIAGVATPFIGLLHADGFDRLLALTGRLRRDPARQRAGLPPPSAPEIPPWACWSRRLPSVAFEGR